jgi:imidazoleglycerol-phosphate dehydratase
MSFGDKNMGDLPLNLIGHFLDSFASEARLNLHARIICGNDDHHKAEATFKALARALDAATRFDPRISGKVPSTKDVID